MVTGWSAGGSAGAEWYAGPQWHSAGSYQAAPGGIGTHVRAGRARQAPGLISGGSGTARDREVIGPRMADTRVRPRSGQCPNQCWSPANGRGKFLEVSGGPHPVCRGSAIGRDDRQVVPGVLVEVVAAQRGDVERPADFPVPTAPRCCRRLRWSASSTPCSQQVDRVVLHQQIGCRLQDDCPDQGILGGLSGYLTRFGEPDRVEQQGVREDSRVAMVVLSVLPALTRIATMSGAAAAPECR